MIKFIGEWTPEFLEYLWEITQMLGKQLINWLLKRFGKQLMEWLSKQMGEPQLAIVEPVGDIRDTLEIKIKDARTGKIISRKTY